MLADACLRAKAPRRPVADESCCGLPVTNALAELRLDLAGRTLSQLTLKALICCHGDGGQVNGVHLNRFSGVLAFRRQSFGYGFKCFARGDKAGLPVWGCDRDGPSAGFA